MRLLKLFSIIVSVLLAFSLVACEEQGSPSSRELDNGNGVSSTDFNPNAHKPSNEPEVIYVVNEFTGLNTLLKEHLVKMPVAIAIANSQSDKTIQTGISKADIVFEAEIESGETGLLAVFKSPASDTQIGPVIMGREIFANISLSLKAKLACNGIEPEHAQSLLNAYRIDSLQLADGGYASLSNEALYTSGALLDTAAKDAGLSVPEEISPWCIFSQNRPVSEAPAAKLKISFNSASSTEFAYDPQTKTYQRFVAGSLATDYLTGETDEYTNLFVLAVPTVAYKECDHLDITLVTGEGKGTGYYFSNGAYEEITWERREPSASITFMDKNGNLLSVFSGRSYVALVNEGRINGITVE